MAVLIVSDHGSDGRWPRRVPPCGRFPTRDEPLRLADLPAGTWRIRVSWNGQPVLKNPIEIKVQKETKTSIDLPRGAIEGQDEETLKRAGRM